MTNTIFSFRAKGKIWIREIRKHTIFQLLFYITFFSFAQDFNYFNNRYDITANGSFDVVSTVIKTDKRYIISGTSGDNSINDNWFISLLIIDQFGTVVKIKTIGNNIANYITQSPGSMIKYNDTTFYSVGLKRIYTPTWVHDKGMLISYNKQFDTLWSKYYGEKTEPYDTSFLLYQIKKTETNALTIIGGWMPYGLPSWVWLFKTDSLGNKVWEKSFGNGYHYYKGYSVIQTTDGGYAIGAYYYELGNNYSGDPIIIKTDSLGNQQWIKYLGGPFVDYYPMLCNSIDGNIIAGYSIADSMPNPNKVYLKPKVVKLDNSGNIIWQNEFGESGFMKLLKNTQLTSNGDYLMTGYMYNNYPHITGWILKVNSSGDSLWYREYDLLKGEDSENLLSDVIESSDNGIIAIGSVRPRNPDIGTMDFWVIKLDSIGCPYPECDTTVGIVEIPVAEAEGLVVYPNPAAEWLQVTGCGLQDQNRKSKTDNRQSTMYICIYDIYGRKVEEIVVPEGRDQMRIDVSGYQNGIYLAVLYSESQIIGRKKFVVAR